MSKNERTNLPIEINLLDENKKIVELNKDFESFQKYIDKQLKLPKYDSLVSIDNLPSMKKSATELNQTAEFISTFRKNKKASETKDIDIFEENLKGVCKTILAKRRTLLDGIAKAEKQTLTKRVETAKNFLLGYYEETNLRNEFKTVTVDDMVQKKFFTEKEALAKDGKDEVEKRVNEQLALQNKVDNRILSLENECLKAGIEPLTVEFIQPFLYDDDINYKDKLDGLIGAQKNILFKQKERAEVEARIKAEKEAKEKVLAEQKALKDELHARYESAIKTADIPNLTRINIELKSYDVAATYELRELSTKREKELLEPKQEEVQEVDESPQEEHLKAIQEEEVKEVPNPYHVSEDGKVSKTLSIKIRVPESATDEQVIDAVIRMIKADRFPLENIEVK